MTEEKKEVTEAVGPKLLARLEFASYYEDNTMAIYRVPEDEENDKFKKIVTVKTPMMGTKNAKAKIEAECYNIHAQGLYIESHEWVRTPIFDRKGGKTTCHFTVRPCKTEEEAQYVTNRVHDLFKIMSDIKLGETHHDGYQNKKPDEPVSANGIG